MAGSTQSTPRGSGRGHRVTIADIAHRAGVTCAAVSLAVNGRPGVSEVTRERIIAIARELQWEPSPAARALAGAPVLTIGMVLARPAEVLGAEAFFGAFVAGLQEVLSREDYSLQMKIVETPEAEIGRASCRERVWDTVCSAACTKTRCRAATCAFLWWAHEIGRKSRCGTLHF